MAPQRDIDIYVVIWSGGYWPCRNMGLIGTGHGPNPRLGNLIFLNIKYVLP